jgi:hypothetical protein
MNIMRYCNIFLVLIGFTLPSMAYAEEPVFSWGDDVFAAGNHVTLVDRQYDDIFAAGNTIFLHKQSTGDNVLAANTIIVDAPVGGDLYAFSNGLTINAPVAGDSSLACNTINIKAPITGDLRAASATIGIHAPVTGSVLIAADDVYLDAALAGTVGLAVKTISFGPNARINGRLTIYGDASQFNIPNDVIAAQRIAQLNLSDFAQQDLDTDQLNVDASPDIFSMLIQVALLTVVIMALVTILPQRTQSAVIYMKNHFWRAIGRGFMLWSFLFGAVVVSALTVVGIVLIPIWLLMALLAGFLGYAMGCYLIGSRIGQLLSWPAPAHWLHQLKVVLLGVLIVVLLSLVPYIEWWLILVVSCLGQGAMTHSRRA